MAVHHLLQTMLVHERNNTYINQHTLHGLIVDKCQPLTRKLYYGKHDHVMCLIYTVSQKKETLYSCPYLC